jgi:hypothetical protein
MCMCVYMNVHMYVQADCMYGSVYVCVYLNVHMYMQAGMEGASKVHIITYAYVDVCECMYVYVCKHVGVYARM